MCNSNENKVRVNDPAFLQHLAFLQGIIARMAGYSSLYKTISITLTAAAIALLSQKTINTLFLLMISIIAICAFAWIDAKYLNLEQSFRREYDSLIEKVHKNNLIESELFKIRMIEVPFYDSLKSWSVSVFYITLIILLIISAIFLGAPQCLQVFFSKLIIFAPAK